ncbi:MAG: transposase [Cyanobacteriota bacterium]|nr:transposase [Cyanobacteriota bacterium]
MPINKTNAKLKVTRRKLPHWQLDGSVYHITFVTWERLELNEPARKLVLDSCLFFNLKRYEVFAAVIMTDHVHLLIQPWQKLGNNNGWQLGDNHHRRDACSTGFTEYWSVSSIMHSIKSFTSKQIPKVMKHIGTVWEDESHDHIIRDERDFLNTWEYIRQNPVKAGLSAIPEAYPFFWQKDPGRHP